jgi:hypothetical protein
VDVDNLLIRADLLRTAVSRVIANIREIELLPGAGLVRGSEKKISLPEVRAELEDLIQAQLDPLVAQAGRGLGRQAIRWLDQSLTHFLHLGRQGGLMANYRPRLSASQKIRFARAALPRSPGQFDLDTGINIIGPLDRVSGLGVSARGYLDGLRRAGFTQVGCQAQQREFAIQKSASSLPTFPPWLPDARINLVHMNGDTLPVMIKAHGDGFLQGRYNIAVWYWELPTLRPEWQATMKNFHDFWAATPFIARALQQSTAKPGGSEGN